MKRSVIVIIIFLAGFQILCGQDVPDKLAGFQKELLKQYSSYFTSAGLTEGQQLKLNATQDYLKLSRPERKTMMDRIIRSWQGSLVIVQKDTYKELWGWDSNKAESDFIDSWDIDVKAASSSASMQSLKISKHPWFFYIGNMMKFDSNDNINAALNLRIGFFMLKDKWDLAASFSEQVYGNIENESSSSVASAGLSSKVYFPVKKYNISPYVGGQASVSIPEGGKASFSPSGLVGLSWFAGMGSLDIGMNLGNSTMLMIGYTIIPNYRFSK